MWKSLGDVRKSGASYLDFVFALALANRSHRLSLAVAQTWIAEISDLAARSGTGRLPMSVVRDFETGGGLNQERDWRIMVDVTRLVCGEATDGFGWSCV